MAGRVRFGLIAALALAQVAIPAGAQEDGDAKPVVTAAVQVTANPHPTRAHSSPQIVRNPETDELVIVETDVSAASG